MHSIKHTNNIIIGKHMKMSCFKFHQNRIINEEFDYWDVKVAREGGYPDFKKPHTERWSQPTPKISAL